MGLIGKPNLALGTPLYMFQTFDNDSEMLAPDLYYHRGCIKCKECGRGPDSDTPMMMAPR